MPEHPDHLDTPEHDTLRLLSRSPHPYHHQNSDLLDPSDSSDPLAYKPSTRHSHDAPSVLRNTSREITPSSDSGTEADDEHFLKGLPAPKRLRKGLRGRNEVLSGTATPIPSPALLEEEGRKLSYNLKKEFHQGKRLHSPADRVRRRKEVIRRSTELFIIIFLGLLLRTNTRVQPILRRWNRELYTWLGITTFLVFLYPLRLVIWAYYYRTPSKKIPLSCEAFDDPEDSDGPGSITSKGPLRSNTMCEGVNSTKAEENSPFTGNAGHRISSNISETKPGSTSLRRHTLPSMDSASRKSHTHTPSGRRKRTASYSVRAFFSLTQEQAATRKWIYAAYVYACIVGALFIPLPFIGIKRVIAEDALHGHEPVGWALGYLFGDLSRFRWEIISHNLERWVCLPPRPTDEQRYFDSLGWVDRLRQLHIGKANTRLVLSAYFLAIIAVGLVVVFRLSPIYEVDTRRKVFHFMMVAMFLPATYIDPTFVALALSIVLAVFLLLDLLRASQLPPLSKPLASFLAPYVDGRDLRGPVVISHIFLLIGCAIPLWLSLGSLPRTGAGFLEGWELPSREVSMVSGVVCVGLGDAAASLIGRRYGQRKWLWGGGKSLEGSVAFALAVFVGLTAAHTWLHAGGWPPTNGNSDLWATATQRMGVCAVTASLTEAVLTGGNDNVIVPVVLWTCVKSLGI
ncbi:hypothetical protein ABKA04_001482 [Annulohypoxylon sp. FPYF3050]